MMSNDNHDKTWLEVVLDRYMDQVEQLWIYHEMLSVLFNMDGDEEPTVLVDIEDQIKDLELDIEAIIDDSYVSRETIGDN